jgi:hypothetical protein
MLNFLILYPRVYLKVQHLYLTILLLVLMVLVQEQLSLTLLILKIEKLVIFTDLMPENLVYIEKELVFKLYLNLIAILQKVKNS